ncbi:MAG: terminase [Mogibacterium sp.]|nr:terminase [Mogibacterium sp.]MBR4090415.1 terminase [Mogibacterium sp.]
MGKRARQVPTFTNVPAKGLKSKGAAAAKLYEATGQHLMRWQQMQVRGIMAIEPGGLWKYIKYCICVSRRNGKGEILAAREFYGIIELGEKICHTAHRTTTSHDAFVRLYTLLKKAGYEEHSKKKADMPERSFYASKQYGLERIEIYGGGIIDFRTRTNNGGLGEGFDVLVIDEAQEYTSKQESALAYTVSASPNPQTILVGTPPTAASGGDVFGKIRHSVIDGIAQETGWSEWSIDQLTNDIDNADLWYDYNPSLGTLISERNVRAELTVGAVDFCIQRLGLWLEYSQKSVISAAEWSAIQGEAPELMPERFWGVKYGHDGVNVALSVAARTTDGRIFVEAIDTASARLGDAWLLDYFRNPGTVKVVVDGSSGQRILAESMRDAGIKAPLLPKVAEIISASSYFEQAIASGQLTHAGQPELAALVTNCEHRPIGSGGGFGYKSLSDDQDITLMDSAVLAVWACGTTRTRKKQTISY